MLWKSISACLIGLLGLATVAELSAQPPRRIPPDQRRPEFRRPGQFRPGQRPEQGNHRFPDKLKEGDKAPDFTLKTLDGEAEVTLSDFNGEMPVALVFGSYT